MSFTIFSGKTEQLSEYPSAKASVTLNLSTSLKYQITIGGLLKSKGTAFHEERYTDVTSILQSLLDLHDLHLSF